MDRAERSSVDARLQMLLQDLLLTTTTLHEFLTQVAHYAVDAGPDQPVSCGITVRTSPKRPYTAGSSDGSASRLDEVQYTVQAGPCLHALETGTCVEIPDMGRETRWPEFVHEAGAVGVRSTLSMPLAAQQSTVGALNYYLSTPTGGGASAEQLAHARNVAAHAAGAVALAGQLAEHARLNADLRTALTSRSTIDHALGIIMGQQRCTAETAFTVLRRHSQNNNLPLRTIAANLIRHVSGAEPDPGRPVD